MEKYGQQMVDDIKAVLRVLVLYLPIPLFWALFDQQGSRWTFQATRMDGQIGPITIKPDQMQVANPLLILTFIPLFNTVIYPILAKVSLRTPLQKLCTGGILAAVAFIISGVVELKLETTYPVLPSMNEGQVRIFNGAPCQIEALTELPKHNLTKIAPLGLFEEKHIMLKRENISFKIDYTSQNKSQCAEYSDQLELTAGKAITYFIHNELGLKEKLVVERIEDYVDKPKRGLPLVRILANTLKLVDIKFQQQNGERQSYVLNSSDFSSKEMQPDKYKVYVGTKDVTEVELRLGGSYVFLIQEDFDLNIAVQEFVIVQPNSVHMLWLLPQYIIITAAEVMFSVTGLEFSFTQAPNSMKSVLQATWLLVSFSSYGSVYMFLQG